MAQNLVEFHPVTKIFPMMTEDEMDDLCNDILLNGLLEPIWTFEGKIIDGRNRYVACLNVGVEPTFREWQGQSNNLVDFVVSENMIRRHLTPSQKAISAAKSNDLYSKYAQEAKKRLSDAGKAGGEIAGKGRPLDDRGVEMFPHPYEDDDAGKTRDAVGRVFDVSGKYVDKAKKILDKAPDLADRIESGKMNIPQAEKEIERRERSVEIRKHEVKGKYDMIFAEFPNHTKIDDLIEMGRNIREISNENCALFIWCPSPSLEDILSVTRTWGFRYRASIVWDRVIPTQGKYMQNRHEFLLLCGKGDIYPDTPSMLESIQRIEATPDGKRPEKFKEFAQQIFPNYGIIYIDGIIDK